MATVQPDFGGILEPIAGRLRGGHDDALHHDLPVEHRHDLGRFLDRGSNCGGEKDDTSALYKLENDVKVYVSSTYKYSHIFYHYTRFVLYGCVNASINNTTNKHTFDIEVQVGIKLSKFVPNVTLVNATVSWLWLLQRKELGVRL